MKNLNENNEKIIPLTEEELKNATGGAGYYYYPSERCQSLTEDQCLDCISQMFCRWDASQGQCVSR